jgi:SAM-dependent methyltransferase
MINKILYPFNLKSLVRKYSLDFIKSSSTIDTHIVDVGCGEMPLEKEVKKYCFKYTGVDIEAGFYKNKKPDVYGTAYETTMPDGSCDLVVSMQVFEHLKYPQVAMKEVRRILKDDGTFVVSFPFCYPLHAAPYDYFRYTNFGFITLLEDEGFKVESVKEISGLFLVWAVFLYNHFLYRKPFLPIGLLFTWSFLVFHKIEELIFALRGADIEKYRSQFVSNYVIKAKKK